ncbi:Serpin peptidase inhibitor, clade B (Ovalbumin), member [Globodera pallida]|nr:Serpin peptidase inhibitor, clade B (Ovalbumin), member [Globodera pallida]
MASSDLTLFNLATVLVVLLIQTVQFSGCQTNQSLLPSPTSNASDVEELCRHIEGTAFHKQCLLSEVVKQKGFIPRHLRPPWLNVSLFEDNQLPEEKALGNGCYACYKGSTASNGVNPDEEYCACSGRVQEMRGLHLDLRGEAVQWRDPFAIGHANFSVDILKMFYHYNAVEIYSKNVILSPLSAAIALAMAYIGARGQTLVEIGKVLAGDSSGPSLRDNYGKFLQEIGPTQTDDNFNLKISTKLFLADSVKVLDEFKLAINAHFGEDNFESIDFRQQNEVANVDMMLQIGEFMHMDEEEFELLGVPYVDEKAHLVILLPKGHFFGSEIGLNTFNGAKLMDFVEKSAMKELEVILPKFKIESFHHNLEETLLLLGIKRAFLPSKADFSGINYNNLSYTLYINKHGTTSSASTAAPKSVDGSFESNRAPAGTPTFQADRPFAFFITLNKKHVIFSGIFMGEQ